MRKIPYLIIAWFLFASCKKTANPEAPVPASAVNVYTSGSSFDKKLQTWVPTYWVDTVQHFMSDYPANSFGNAVFCSGNQVYVGGENDAGAWPPVPGLWMNGSPQNMSTTDKSAIVSVKSVFVSGTDVYLAGFGPDASGNFPNAYGRAKWWKNGITKPLGYDSVYSEATDIAVSGSDVYITWYEMKPNGRYGAWYNKNETATELGANYFEAYPQAVCVSGPDVYILGYVYDSLSSHFLGVYWKNGVMNAISTADPTATGTDITVSGQDIYISGTSQVPVVGRPVYWKNGQANLLGDGTVSSTTSGIAVSGDDVFVSGKEILKQLPVYWKNGVLQHLSSSSLYDVHNTTGISVMKK